MGLRHQDTATKDELFEKILDASNQAAKIVKVVLGLARNRKKTKEATDLKEIVEAVLLLLSREMSKFHIQVDKKIQDVPQVLVNGNQIQQVLINLLVNARQASPTGGIILIKLHKAQTEANYVDLVIRDHGVGIPKEKLPHIFDAFYSTKKGPDSTGKGGTGLGLYISRQIVEDRMNGRIQVKNTPGGVTCEIFIPADKGDNDGDEQ